MRIIEVIVENKNQRLVDGVEGQLIIVIQMNLNSVRHLVVQQHEVDLRMLAEDFEVRKSVVDSVKKEECFIGGRGGGAAFGAGDRRK